MGFKNIIGQEKATDFLVQVIKNSSLPHALLFYGPAGVGKRTTALTLAKILNCVHQNFDYCNHCDSCHKIDTGMHPDVHLIDVQSTNDTVSINQIRKLIKETQYKPWEGKWRVFIINSTEKMRLVAANSLLKTLEEPPAYVLLIVISENKNMLPLTILSRCQPLPFSTLTKEQIISVLINQHGIPFDQAEELTEYSNGSVGQALELCHDGFLQEKKMLEKFWTEAKSLNIESILTQSTSWNKIKYKNPDITEPESSDEHKNKSKTISKDETTRFFLHWLLVLERDLKSNYEQVIPIMKKILQAKKQLRSNVNRELIFDNLALEMYKIKNSG